MQESTFWRELLLAFVDDSARRGQAFARARSSQGFSAAARFADHIVLMNEGRVVANETPAEGLSVDRIREVSAVEPTFVTTAHSDLHIIFD